MRTYVFAGGGSGGHLYPALAVAGALRSSDPRCRVMFIAGRRAVESEILSREPYPSRALDCASMADLRRNPPGFLWKHWRACRIAACWLLELQPCAVIGCGGYQSVPVALAASRLGIPLILLEQNVVPGRATSWLSLRADCVCASYEETATHLPRARRVVVTGNPVRPEIAALTGLRREPSPQPTLLILGGSQGASSVNDALLRFAEQNAESLRGWRIIHQTGARDESRVRGHYARLGLTAHAHGFLVDMAAQYAQAELVISRAGATTLAELACAGVPAVLIPYPRAVRDHQRQNAEHYVRAGGAFCIREGSHAALSQTLLRLLHDDELRREMSRGMQRAARPDAAANVLGVLAHLGLPAAA